MATVYSFVTGMEPTAIFGGIAGGTTVVLHEWLKRRDQRPPRPPKRGFPVKEITDARGEPRAGGQDEDAL